MSKKIGYCKLGRSMSFDPGKHGFQGDAEAPNLLRRLAERNPDTEFYITGRNDWVDPQSIGMPSNIINPWLEHRDSWKALKLEHADNGALTPEAREKVMAWFGSTIVPLADELDGMIVHLGQHGTSHIPIPFSNKTWTDGSDLTRPLDWAMLYGANVTWMLNRMGDRTDGQAPVSWVCTDPRNYMKARDVKWPTGLNRILSQHMFTRTGNHDRFQDLRMPEKLGFDAKAKRGGEVWEIRQVYRHAGLELMILPDDWSSWGAPGFSDRAPVGIASTSYWDDVPAQRRSWYIVNWLLKQFPEAEVYGKWDKKCLANDLGPYTLRDTDPRNFEEQLGSWRTTMALPPATRSSDGALWTTAKPFQCFAARVACFFAGSLDAQGWMIPNTTRAAGTKPVGDGLFSVREDWTEGDLHLAKWLRCKTAEEFAKKALALSYDEDAWTWVVNQQRDLLQRRWDAHFTEVILEHQMGLTS